MANAREILDRMKSIQDTMKITNAMTAVIMLHANTFIILPPLVTAPLLLVG